MRGELKNFVIMLFGVHPYFEISKRMPFGKSGYKTFTSITYKAIIPNQSFNFSESQFPPIEPRIAVTPNSRTYSKTCKYTLVYLNIIYEV